MNEDPDRTLARDERVRGLKERAWREVDAIDRALELGEIDENEWHEAMGALIKRGYLTARSPYAQSGHGGAAESWEASRGFVARAIERSGSFLDVGCAGGVMMESVERWGSGKGLRIEPYGLEIVPELVELAQRRLPRWKERIFLGNIRSWKPEGALFDMVLIRPEYAPLLERAELIRHVLNEVVVPGGRLIVLLGTEEKNEIGAEPSLVGSGLRVAGRIALPHQEDDGLVRRLFWIEKPL